MDSKSLMDLPIGILAQTPPLEFLMSMHVKHRLSTEQVDASTANLKTPEGFGRHVFPVTGGAFSGPKLKGTVCELGAADWTYRYPDGRMMLDVRLTLKTDDGEYIYWCVFAKISSSLSRLSQSLTCFPSVCAGT